jgi:hypothetical protein
LNGIGFVEYGQVPSSTGEEQCQIFGPVEPRRVGQGRRQMRAMVGEAKTILGLKTKKLMVSSRTVARSRWSL